MHVTLEAKFYRRPGTGTIGRPMLEIPILDDDETLHHPPEPELIRPLANRSLSGSIRPLQIEDLLRLKTLVRIGDPQ
jgi:hypothetical protein